MLQITPQERLALTVTALLLSVGTGARVLALNGPPPDLRTGGMPADTREGATPPGLRASVDRRVAERQRASAPLRPGERLDVNHASAVELERLPRVGPGLAARIVAHRAEHGPFRSLAELDAVPGVGPALLATLAPVVTLPAAPGPPATRAGPPGAAPLDLNRATAPELEALPGIGPALAERIVGWRREHGPFRSVQELDSVPGIGPGLLERIAPRLRAGL